VSHNTFEVQYEKPVEYLWRNVKKEATHNKYFEAFEHLVHSVDQALAAFADRAEAVLSLFGCYCKELGLAPAPGI
jgi:hypothetical protein